MNDLCWWPVDPLIKVFEDATPPEAAGPVVIEAARGETASGQAVLFSPTIHLMGARLEATPLVPEAGGSAAELAPPQLRFVGFVPVRQNTRGTPEEHLVRAAPALFPDPLLDHPSLHLRKGRAQPIWITVEVPPDARPGRYRGRVGIRTRDGQVSGIDCLLDVHAARVPAGRRLRVTNWFSLSAIARYHGLEQFSEPFWEMLDRYARLMGEHRQNTVITPLFQLIRPYPDGDRIALDFSRFDRYVSLFERHGVAALIEGGHLGGRRGGWNEGFSLTIWELTDGTVRTARVAPESAEADRFLAWFLPSLRTHLAARGWEARYVQHLADEPVDANAESYNQLVRAVRRHWPTLKLIEATMCQTIEPLDIWVPILNAWHRAADFYRSQREMGREVWFYTCLGPTGTYANRLIDYPTLKVRLLHWLNAHYGAAGYLHWGLNYWDGVASPFSDVEPAHGRDLTLPPGDCGIV
ncbi:MAG TPA: glycoside hydrolase domain-containing protein, partial [Limnochordia bacterium]